MPELDQLHEIETGDTVRYVGRPDPYRENLEYGATGDVVESFEVSVRVLFEDHDHILSIHRENLDRIPTGGQATGCRNRIAFMVLVLVLASVILNLL